MGSGLELGSWWGRQPVLKQVPASTSPRRPVIALLVSYPCPAQPFSSPGRASRRGLGVNPSFAATVDGGDWEATFCSMV
jgi:hypothetical protein